MPTVNITSACVYNAAVKVTGVLTGDKSVPVTAYTVEVTPHNGSVIRLVTNKQSSGGPFEFCGTTPDNAPIALPCAVRVITNRQAQDSKQVEQPCNPLIGFLPQGSYRESCRDIRVVLSCKAEDGSGGAPMASIDLSELVCPDVYNEYGVLKVGSGHAAQDGFKPGGSWKQSCSDIKVGLTCKARKSDGSWTDASFDLTGLHEAALRNENGVLRNTTP